MTKGDETRSAVLGSAIALASTLGLERVTIGKLADHVGMSKSGLFAHFSSKENLQVAVLEEAIARFIALVVSPARQLGEPLLLEDRGDDGRAERLAVTSEGAADVVDGEVLLPQGDDPIAEPLLLAWRPAFACVGEEEVALALLAELMDEDAKAARSIAEPPGRFGRGDTLDEEGAEGLVLPMVGVGWLQELAGQC